MYTCADAASMNLQQTEKSGFFIWQLQPTKDEYEIVHTINSTDNDTKTNAKHTELQKHSEKHDGFDNKITALSIFDNLFLNSDLCDFLNVFIFPININVHILKIHSCFCF